MEGAEATVCLAFDDSGALDCDGAGWAGRTGFALVDRVGAFEGPARDRWDDAGVLQAAALAFDAFSKL